MAAGSKTVIVAALIGNAAIAVTKFVAAALTGSAAMLSEGIHSLVDTGNQVLLLFGMKRAQLPASQRFPYGHGKEIYFWSFVVAISIFGVGAGVSIWEGVLHMLDPHPIEDPTINYVVLAIALCFEFVAWWMAARAFGRTRRGRGWVETVKRGKDPTLFVVLFEDSAAMLGLVVAFLGIWMAQVTGVIWLDGLASVIIGLILAGTAIWLAVETKSLLIGEAAEPEVEAGVRAICEAEPIVEGIHEILTLHMGPDFILVNLSVDFADTGTAQTLEEAIARMDVSIREAFPRVRRVFIEAEGPADAGADASTS